MGTGKGFPMTTTRAHQAAAAMIADLHAHYPMHVDDPPGLRRLRTLWARRGEVSGWSAWVEWIRGLLTLMVSPLFNYQSICSGPRASTKYLCEGEVGVALSVLYQFFDEVLDPRVLIEGPEPQRRLPREADRPAGAG